LAAHDIENHWPWQINTNSQDISRACCSRYQQGKVRAEGVITEIDPSYLGVVRAGYP
jgi:hypothetical protein